MVPAAQVLYSLSPRASIFGYIGKDVRNVFKVVIQGHLLIARLPRLSLKAIYLWPYSQGRGTLRQGYEKSIGKSQ